MNFQSKLKLLYISHTTEFAGAEKALYLLLKNLNPLFFKVIAVFPSNSGIFIDKIKELNIKYYSTPLEWWITNPKYNFPVSSLSSRVNKLLKIIDIEKPDIIHTNTSVIIEGAIAANKKNIPHIWHLHEILQTHPVLKPILPLPMVYNMINEYSDKVICVSKALKDTISKFVPSKKLDVIYNGTDLESELQEKTSVRKQLSLKNDTILATSVGNITPQKDFMTLLKLALKVKQNQLNIKFLIVGRVGSKTYNRKLLSFYKKENLLETVFFLGYRKDIYPIIEQSDLVIITSQSESFSLVAIESMVLKKAVLTTNCGGPSEIILDGKTGYIVPVGRVDLLYDRLQKLTKSQKRNSMGREGYKRYKDYFTVHQFKENFEKLYQFVIQNSNTTIQKNEYLLTSMQKKYEKILTYNKLRHPILYLSVWLIKSFRRILIQDIKCFFKKLNKNWHC